jgi:hypothetical protein
MAMQGVYQTKGSANLSTLPAGMAQMQMQTAKSISAGFEGLAEGIDEYYEGKKEREFLTKEFEALQEYADDRSGASGKEHGEAEGWGDAFAKSYKGDLAKDIKDFSSLSTSQMKGKLMGMKFQMSQFEKDRAFELQKRGVGLQEQGLEMRGEQFDETLLLQQQAASESQSQFDRLYGQSQEKIGLQQQEIDAASGKAAKTAAANQRNLQALQSATGPAQRLPSQQPAYQMNVPYTIGQPLPTVPGRKMTPQEQWRNAAGQAGTAEFGLAMLGKAPDAAVSTFGQNVGAARATFEGEKRRLETARGKPARIPGSDEHLVDGKPFRWAKDEKGKTKLRAIPESEYQYEKQEAVEAPYGLLTQAISQYGIDDKAVARIEKDFGEVFGGKERVGTAFHLGDQNPALEGKWVFWREKNSAQVLDLGAGSSFSKELMETLVPGVLTGGVFGTDAEFRSMVEREIETIPDQAKRGRMLSEVFGVRAKAKAAMLGKRVPKLDPHLVRQVATNNEMIQAQTRHLLTAKESELPEIRAKIEALEKANDAIYDKHEADSRERGEDVLAPPGARERSFNPRTGKIE